MYQIRTIDRMNDYTQYTVLSTDTDNLTESVARVTGLKSLSFDKVNGAANGTSAGAYRSVKLSLEEDGIQLHDKVQWGIYISALTNVASCYLKLGTDATNNMQWTIADTSLRTGWTLCTGVVGEPSAINANGWDPTNITYMEIGVTFDAETNALAGILVDSVSIVPSRYSEDNTTISMDGVDVEIDTDDMEALLTTIDADTGAMVTDLAAIEVLLGTIDTDTGAMVVDLAAIEVLLGTIDTDTGAMVTDLAAIEVLLGTIDTDTGAMVTDLAAIEVLLGTIDTDTGNIATYTQGSETALELIDDIIGTIGSAFSGKVAVLGGKAESTVPTEVSDAQAVAAWIDTFGRYINPSYDLSQGVDQVQDATAVSGVPMKVTGITQLTAAGSTAGQNVEGYANGCWSYTIASIDTSVEVKVEGTVDGSNWFNMDANDLTTTKTANGTYCLRYYGAAISQTRFTFVDETGGANATIDCDFMAGN